MSFFETKSCYRLGTTVTKATTNNEYVTCSSRIYLDTCFLKLSEAGAQRCVKLFPMAVQRLLRPHERISSEYLNNVK